MTRPPRRALLALATLLAGAGALPTAWASKPRIRLEQVDVRRCAAHGEVRAYVAELELEGTLQRFAAKRYRLIVDGQLVDRPPVAARRFRDSGSPLELVVVVQANLSYKDDLPLIKEGLTDLLTRLPPRARVSLLAYGWGVDTLLSQGDAARAKQVVARLATRLDEFDLALLPAATRGLALLGKSDARRRLLVIVANGINHDPRRDLFVAFADRARDQGVTIHPIAFSANDERGPLLNLGEIAKRTNGTLRWARSPADIPGQLRNLALEINRQQVLTFAVPDGCQREHLLQIARGSLRSNTLRSPAQPGGGAGRGARIAKVALIAVACLVLLGTPPLLYLLVTRRRQREAKDAAPEHPPVNGPRTLALFVIAPTGDGPSVALTPGTWRIGTAPDCLVRAPDGLGVEVYHAELRVAAESLVICDLAAPGGTWVNGQRVQQAALAPGDRLQLGQLQLDVAVV